MDLDENVWSKLPIAILDTVVAFLPLAKLARFQCTNHHFKSWISSAPFNELRAKLPLQTTCLFVHTHNFYSVTGNVEIPGSISRSFLTGDEVFWQHYIRGYKSKNSKLLAAAGRFLFLQYGKILAVFDLKTKTGVTLPEHPLLKGLSSNTLVFGGDQTTGAFKVAVLALEGMPDQPPLGIFDSEARTWMAEQFPYGLKSDAFESAILGNKLFILESAQFSLRGAPYNLMALTLSRNGTTSRELHVEMVLEEIPNYKADMVRPSLHATSTPLFMVACIKEKVLILEVDFTDKKYVEVARVPERFHGMESISITASDACILILVDDRRAFVYDLASKTWRTVVMVMFPNFKGNGMVGKKLDVFMTRTEN